MATRRRSSRHRLPPTVLGDPCQACGRTDLPLETDHAHIPYGKGTKQGYPKEQIESAGNLRWVCHFCNQRKAKDNRESWPDEPIKGASRESGEQPG